MIKVGDSIKYNNVNYIVRAIHNPVFKNKNEVAHFALENNNETMFLPFTAYYRELYEVETQYSNKLEKRWKDLKSRLDDLWRNGDADVHEYAFDVLKLMQQLEEDKVNE